MPETIYVVMLQDRHTDPEAHPFSTEEKALAFAKSVVDDYGHTPDEDDAMSPEALKAAGWLFHAILSTEGDSVWVMPKTLDGGEHA